MGKGRLEAFSDGVLAIIITIMVLGLPSPPGSAFAAMKTLAPSLLSYVLSFVYVGIYWNNHHHMLQATKRVTGSVLWANLHLLFWLSLFPFTTNWIGLHHHESAPTAVYGFVLLMAALAYFILQGRIIAADGPQSLLKTAIGADWKGKASAALYLSAIIASFKAPWLAQAIYALVALIWLAPDRRIERLMNRSES